MSPGNLYYHYRNKEDIVRGLFERLSAEWRVLYTLPEDRGPTLTDLDGMLRGHFQALWRYVGVAVGEHLGFFFTAMWTAMVAGLLLRRSPWLRRSGTILAVGIAAGLLEPFGVAAAGLINAVSYVLWAGWLIAFGIGLLRGAALRPKEAR